MGYYIDLEKITIADYVKKLETAYLPPSRKILRERLEVRFSHFTGAGAGNVKELLQLLKNKKRVAELQKVACLSGDYLTILLRELNSMLPKPNKLSNFTGISKDTIDKLEKEGIRNTEKLFGRVVTRTARRELALLADISEKEIIELTRLADLSRIKWVGATFARMLYDLGIDSVQKAARADPEQLHAMINQMNREKSIYKGQIGLNDIRIFVNAAKEVPLDIEY